MKKVAFGNGRHTYTVAFYHVSNDAEDGYMHEIVAYANNSEEAAARALKIHLQNEGASFDSCYPLREITVVEHIKVWSTAE